MSRPNASPTQVSGKLLLGATAVAVGAALVSACTGGRNDEPPLATDPATVVALPETTPPAEPIEFEFQLPDPACPASADLESLPLDHENQYVVDQAVHEYDERFLVLCGYERAEAAGESEDIVLDDHAFITSEITLHRSWGEGPRASRYLELPVGSDNLRDWEAAVWARDDRGIWWEGCGPATPCEEGQEPTIQTHARRLRFEGRVGNLEFYVRVTYIAERLPPDVESRIVGVFRDLVLAVVNSFNRAD